MNEKEERQYTVGEVPGPTEIVHKYCKECLGLTTFNVDMVTNCQGNQLLTGDVCAFYKYRLGKRASVKVIREFCLQCMCGQPSLVPDCESDACHCHPYRMGKRPYGSNREWTEEQKQAVAERFKKAREAKANEIIRSECMSAMDFCD